MQASHFPIEEFSVWTRMHDWRLLPCYLTTNLDLSSRPAEICLLCPQVKLWLSFLEEKSVKRFVETGTLTHGCPWQMSSQRHIETDSSEPNESSVGSVHCCWAVTGQTAWVNANMSNPQNATTCNDLVQQIANLQVQGATIVSSDGSWSCPE